MRMFSVKRCIAVGFLSCVFISTSGTNLYAIQEDPSSNDLSSMSLEQLTHVEVSSVARRDQQLYKTPAAVFVVTQDDIRRSGASSIPELLRIVPGVQVAQVQANKWAVSARGFNGIFADKMLIMIDGRTVYTPIYSGTFWDQNEVLMEDIERIEVVRGPGGTMWGANAVNGVLNIITKKASASSGRQLVLSEGSQDRIASAQDGGTGRGGLEYRIFAKDQRRLPMVTSAGDSAFDAGDSFRAGGRLDWQIGRRDWLTVHGDLYRVREDQQVFTLGGGSGPLDEIVMPSKVEGSGGYALMRWEHHKGSSDTALQVYYNEQNRGEFAGSGREGTTDLDFQDHIAANGRNDVTWGIGYRYNGDHLRGANLPFAHSKHEMSLVSSFLQDEFSVVPNKVVLTVGSKFQWNSYTHLDVQPSVRLLWSPDAPHSVWASVSRAVRTPSIRDRDLAIYFPLPSDLPIPAEIFISGNPAIKPEAALAYEGGYRQQIGKHFSADLAGFQYNYTRLVGQVQGQPFLQMTPSPVYIVPTIYMNDMKANSQGIEGTFSWTPARAVHIASSYAWMQSREASTAGAGVTQDLTWSTPRNDLNLRGAWDIGRKWTTNASFSFISRVPIYNSASPLEQTPVPAYERVDVGVAYSIGESLVVRAGGNNLQSARHLEFNPQDNYNVPSEIARSGYVKLVWSF